MDKCENCGRAIGALETPSLWDDHVVCVQCRGDLSKSRQHDAKQQAVAYARATVPSPPPPPPDPMQQLAAAARQAPARPAALTLGLPQCQQCGGAMQMTAISSGNCAGIVVALICLAAGIFIFFAIPVIGWVIGPVICVGALFMGGKKSKVWKCRACGSVVPRA